MERQAIAFHASAPPDYGPVVYEKTFPSEPSLIPAVIVRLVDFLVNVGFIGEEGKNHFCLCMDEGLKNAVLHGNGADPARETSVQVRKGPDCFWIVISDHGGGFSPEAIPDPFDENGLWKEGGRGIHLMQYYSEGIEYWDGGSTLVLRFLRSAEGEAAAGQEKGKDV